MKRFNKPFYTAIGKRIKRQRLEKGFSREKLAQIANISDKFLYDIEVGNKGISADTLYRISISLEISSDWLLSGKLYWNDFSAT